MTTAFLRAAITAAAFTAWLSAQIPVAKAPAVKSQKEGEAIMAVFNAQDPKLRIEAAEILMNKFGDTEFKGVALQLIAMSYQQLGDTEKQIIYAERLLKEDPKSYSAMLLFAAGVVQTTRENDLDREEKLGRVEKVIAQAIPLINDAPKPRADVPDDQWIAARKEFLSQAHETLGQAAFVRRKFDVAIKEFQLALDTASTPDTVVMLRLGSAYSQAGKPDEAIAILDKVLASPQLDPRVKSAADAEKSKAMAAKTGGKPADPAK